MRDLLKLHYKQLNGQLAFFWNEEQKVSAWAESKGDAKSPPNHQIVITYELARRLYRDAEHYHKYAVNELLNENIQNIYKDFEVKPRLPNHLSEAQSVRNMFIGSLTWVFFHELGHLVQEHGHIRKLFGDVEIVSKIEDCEINGVQALSERASLVSHATELAADFEATDWCIRELIRHFLHPENNDEDAKAEFRNNLQLMVCGISCALYRFNGESNVDPGPIPKGSHPTPIRRLEACLPIIYEQLDFIGTLHGMNRKQLVHLCTSAADSLAFFWSSHYRHIYNVPEHFLIQGMLQDPFKEYWISIIKVWDEMLQNVIDVRRFGSDFGLLTFTDEFRRLLEDSNPQ